MSESSSAEFWIVAVIALVIGLFVGWFVAALLQRRSSGGRSAAQLRAEMQSYREEVNEHFARTAELFKETTEKYRDLYEHLAGGAQGLCDDLPDRTQVEFRPGQLLGEAGAGGGERDAGGRDNGAAQEPDADVAGSPEPAEAAGDKPGAAEPAPAEPAAEKKEQPATAN